MITPGDTVRTMTGKVGVVLAANVPTPEGLRVQVCIGPLTLQFHSSDDPAVIPALAVLYHPSDLTSITPEAPLCSPET